MERSHWPHWPGEVIGRNPQPSPPVPSGPEPLPVLVGCVPSESSSTFPVWGGPRHQGLALGDKPVSSLGKVIAKDPRTSGGGTGNLLLSHRAPSTSGARLSGDLEERSCASPLAGHPSGTLPHTRRSVTKPPSIRIGPRTRPHEGRGRSAGLRDTAALGTRSPGGSSPWCSQNSAAWPADTRCRPQPTGGPKTTSANHKGD